MSEAATNYREFLPVAPLRDFVECIWTRGAITNAPGKPHRVLPDGCIDIVFQIGPRAVAQAQVVGTMSRPLNVDEGAAGRYVGIRFRPGKARLFLDFRAQELTDGQAGLREFWGNAAQELLEEHKVTPGPRQSVALTERALLRRLPRQTGERRVNQTVAAIVQSHGTCSVETLARDAGVTRQHLNHMFRDWVGASPKLFSRVTRFRYLLELLQIRQPIRWADRALEAGYFDQAHLIADFREFAGQSPESYLRNRLSS